MEIPTFVLDTVRNVFQQFFIRIKTKLSTSLIKKTLVFSSLHTHPKFILQISVCKKISKCLTNVTISSTSYHNLYTLRRTVATFNLYRSIPKQPRLSIP